MSDTDSPQVLWSTPYPYGDEPTEWEHVKTTAKQIQVRRGKDRHHATRFDREPRRLPAGAVGRNARSTLFESRAACLRYMMQRADERAAKFTERASAEREKASRYRAELLDAGVA